MLDELNKFLHSEVNQLIQHIIVQDQDGQNNNINVKTGVRGDDELIIFGSNIILYYIKPHQLSAWPDSDFS